MPKALDEAYQMLGRLRSALRKARTGSIPSRVEGNELASVAREVTVSLRDLRLDPVAGETSNIGPLLNEINELAQSLKSQLPRDTDASADESGKVILEAAKSIYDLTDQIYRVLRSLRYADPSRPRV
jgi:hypothetical protein